jgi:hypothetical protein
MRGAHDSYTQNARNNKYDVAKYAAREEFAKVESGVSNYPAFVKEELVFIQSRRFKHNQPPRNNNRHTQRKAQSRHTMPHTAQHNTQHNTTRNTTRNTSRNTARYAQYFVWIVGELGMIACSITYLYWHSKRENVADHTMSKPSVPLSKSAKSDSSAVSTKETATIKSSNGKLYLLPPSLSPPLKTLGKKKTHNLSGPKQITAVPPSKLANLKTKVNDSLVFSYSFHFSCFLFFYPICSLFPHFVSST